jgi:hypothetical protein
VSPSAIRNNHYVEGNTLDCNHFPNSIAYWDRSR